MKALLPTLADYWDAARDILPPDVAAYLFGGAGEEATMRANIVAFEAVRLRPRVPTGEALSIGVTFFGQTFAAPILVAPMGYQRLLHRDGETGLARAAAALGLGYVVPTLSSVPMEDLGAAAEGAPQWFQLYWQPHLTDTLTLLRRAEACGVSAIVLTVDAPVDGPRDRQIRAGFSRPDHVRGVHLQDFSSPVSPHDIASAFQAAPGWAEIGWLCRQTRLPVLLKGVMAGEDAQRALDAGCGGVIVSNHGGRVLDGAMGALEALPEVVQAVAGRVPVLMDSGVRRGTDIAKAILLGASAVLVGRPVACGLAVAGAAGAAHILRLLMDEYAIARGLTSD